MCFSSSQVSVLHPQKNVLILFSFGCFFDRVLSCLCDTFDKFFQHVVSLCFESFHKKDICHWATASILVADGFAVLAFLGSLHHSLLKVFFVSKFCSHS